MRNGLFDLTIGSRMIFRSLLDAMASPGHIITLPQIDIEPSVENKYPLLLLMTLLDHEVSFCVLDHDTRITEYLRSNTQSNESTIEDSDFILVYGGTSHGLIRKARIGALEYPDESATVIYDIDMIGNGSILLELSGPGIIDKRRIRINGIKQTEIEDILSIKDYPLGVDVILSNRVGRIACIPRSTSVNVIS